MSHGDSHTRIVGALPRRTGKSSVRSKAFRDVSVKVGAFKKSAKASDGRWTTRADRSRRA